eukprot:g35341.t1
MLDLCGKKEPFREDVVFWVNPAHTLQLAEAILAGRASRVIQYVAHFHSLPRTCDTMLVYLFWALVVHLGFLDKEVTMGPLVKSGHKVRSAHQDLLGGLSSNAFVLEDSGMILLRGEGGSEGKYRETMEESRMRARS